MCLISYSKDDSYSSKIKLLEYAQSKTPRPLWAYVEITEKCTHGCAWCYGGFNLDKTSFMSVDSFALLTEKLKKIGIRQLTLTGGEPTEHPDFEKILQIAGKTGMLLHIVTHGESIERYLPSLSKNSFRQIQFNYQGKQLHDKQHKVPGSYEKQISAMKAALKKGFEVTATVTVGKYNINVIPDIFLELANIGLRRFRIWESTGKGNPWRKNLEARDIFDFCTREARKLGFLYVQSYDPEFQGDIGVACPPLSKMYFSINAMGELKFCPAVPDMPPIASLLQDEPKTILEKYTKHMDNLLKKNNGQPWCLARSEEPMPMLRQ